jgi:hypothetical protein
MLAPLMLDKLHGPMADHEPARVAMKMSSPRQTERDWSRLALPALPDNFQLCQRT